MLSRLATLLDTTVLVQPVSGVAPTLRVALESFVDSHRSRGGVAMPVLALAALHWTISGSPLLFWDWFSFFASLVSSVACFANCGLVLPLLSFPPLVPLLFFLEAPWDRKLPPWQISATCPILEHLVHFSFDLSAVQLAARWSPAQV